MLDESGKNVQATLAQNLRRLRIARHLSLSELARATGMSKATLSSIENGRANPTVDTLVALAGALRIGLVELLDELPVAEMRVVRAVRGDGDRAASRRLDAFAPETEVEVVEMSLPAAELREVEPRPGGSRTHVYVLQGTLLAGPVERVTELAPGDYASFPSDVPHVYETSRHAARVLVLHEGG